MPIVLEEARQKPVVAAGGIGNGKDPQALLAGASAAALGTRFVATVESKRSSGLKRASRGLRKRHGRDHLFSGWLPATPSRFAKSHLHIWDACRMPFLEKGPARAM